VTVSKCENAWDGEALSTSEKATDQKSWRLGDSEIPENMRRGFALIGDHQDAGHSPARMKGGSCTVPTRERARTPVGSNERAISEIEQQSFRHVCRPPRGRQLESASLTDLEITPESQLGCCANEALQKGPVLRIRSEDEY
jgi:hypothetical protein